jgi:N-acetylmuramoyl-L-alanine amidase
VRRYLLAACLCIALVLAACGSGGEGAGPAAPAAPVASSTATAAGTAAAIEPTLTPPQLPSAESTATAVAGVPAAAPAAPVAVPSSVGAAPRDALVVALPPPAQIAGLRPPVVVVDPGHAADEVGAAANGVVEKESNLDLALRVERVLAAQGVQVVLTRRADVRAYSGPAIAGFSAQRRDLQARVDLANEVRADVFVSLHSNGANSTAERGIEVYFNSARPHSDLNRTLAQLLLDGVIAELGGTGFAAVDRGVKDDACLRAFQGRCFPLFLLGPERTTTRDEVLRRGGNPEALGFLPGQDAIRSRATQMPAALVELLFISNPQDAALLRTEDAREAMARGVARGVLDYLARSPR